jgi:hypothetical protein
MWNREVLRTALALSSTVDWQVKPRRAPEMPDADGVSTAI